MTDPQPLRLDYDDPVFRHGTEAHALDHSILRPEFSDVHPYVADRLAQEANGPVLDLGCGPAKLGKLLTARSVPWTGLDQSPTRLRLGEGPRVLGDACHLPFADATFGAVATLYTLYHFADPIVPMREAHRTMRPGAVFVTCAPSAFDDPELAKFLPPRVPETFDSDSGPAMVARVFRDVEVKRWEMPLMRFPNAEGVWNYLVAHMLEPDAASEAAAKLSYPFWLTKRGATIWARK
ncbi:MAG: class I SAM-dependent methyltransferase [Dehalococcoidia bacterium]